MSKEELEALLEELDASIVWERHCEIFSPRDSQHCLSMVF